MIYVDTSVALAHLLAEDRCPPAELWSESLVSSRLLEYEVWVRLHTRGFAKTHGDAARDLLTRLAWLELTPAMFARALEPFPLQVRTLDALHLASMDHLRRFVPALRVASYDDRLVQAASRMGFEVMPLP